MAERDSHILMRYRGAPEERTRALSSSSTAVEDFLGQFEDGVDRIEAVLRMATVLGSVVQEEFTGISLHLYAEGIREPQVISEFAEAGEGLRLLAGLAEVESTEFSQS